MSGIALPLTLAAGQILMLGANIRHCFGGRLVYEHCLEFRGRTLDWNRAAAA